MQAEPRHLRWRLAGLFALTIFVLFLDAILGLAASESGQQNSGETTLTLVVVGISAAISARAYVLLRRSGRSPRASAIPGFAIGLGPIAILELTALVVQLTT